MAERQFTYIRNLFRNNNKDTKELTKYIFEKNDAFMLWIIGLSFAFIAGIISNIEKIKLLIKIGDLKFTITLLLISIIAGIVYRLLSLFFFTYLDTIFRQIDIALSDSDTMDTEFDLSGNETFEYLVMLNSSFQDLTEVKRVYNLVDNEHKEKLRLEQIEFYRQNTIWAKKDQEVALETINEVYRDTYGINYNIKIKKKQYSHLF